MSQGLLERRHGFRPQRADPLFAALSGELDLMDRLEAEILNFEVDYLLSPCPGVVEKQEQRRVSLGVACLRVDAVEHRPYLRLFEVFNGARRRAFERDIANRLALRQGVGLLSGHVAKECTQGREPAISSVGTVATRRFEVVEKRQNRVRVEVLQAQLIERFSGAPRDELQKQLQAVAIAEDRIVAQPSLCGQIVAEEAVDPVGDALGGVHAGSPIAEVR